MVIRVSSSNNSCNVWKFNPNFFFLQKQMLILQLKANRNFTYKNTTVQSQH